MLPCNTCSESYAHRARAVADEFIIKETKIQSAFDAALDKGEAADDARFNAIRVIRTEHRAAMAPLNAALLSAEHAH